MEGGLEAAIGPTCQHNDSSSPAAPRYLARGLRSSRWNLYHYYHQCVCHCPASEALRLHPERRDVMQYSRPGDHSRIGHDGMQGSGDNPAEQRRER